MAINITAQRQATAVGYGAAAPYGVLFSATPPTTGAATGELSGGGYARQALNWSAATAASPSVITGTGTFNVGSGVSVTYSGVAVSGTAATADIRDIADVPDQAFASAGTYTLTATYSQT